MKELQTHVVHMVVYRGVPKIKDYVIERTVAYASDHVNSLKSEMPFSQHVLLVADLNFTSSLRISSAPHASCRPHDPPSFYQVSILVVCPI